MAQLKDTTVNGTLTLNDTNVNEKLELVDELNSNLMYYNPGDTAYINYWGAGVLTNGNTHIHVTVPLNKQISSKVTSFTSSDISVVLRQNNAYIGGSDATTFISPDSCTLNLSSSGLHFRLEFSSSVGGTNNDAVAILIRANVTFN